MKNPWMSMWLSAANTSASAARGLVAAETKRTQNAVAEEMTRQAMAFWFPWAAPKPKPKPRARRRTRRS